MFQVSKVKGSKKKERIIFGLVEELRIGKIRFENSSDSKGEKGWNQPSLAMVARANHVLLTRIFPPHPLGAIACPANDVLSLRQLLPLHVPKGFEHR